jgi:hypothetical protein
MKSHPHTDGIWVPFFPYKISTVVATTANGSIAIALAVLSAQEMPDIHAFSRNTLRQRLDPQGGFDSFEPSRTVFVIVRCCSWIHPSLQRSRH